MEDFLVDEEQWIAVDPGTQATGTPSTSTQATGTQPTSTPTTVCRRKIGRSWTKEQGVLFDSAQHIRCC